MSKSKIFCLLILLVSVGISPALAKKATHSNHKASHSLAKANRHVTTRHRYAGHHRANRSQGPTVEPIPQEIFPPGHKFTPEEKAEASEIGALEQNGLWKEAFKAASNLNRPKDVIDAVDAAIQNNGGDANRLNLAQLYTLRANALSRLGRKADA